MSSKDFAVRPAGLSLVMPAYDEEEGIEAAVASMQAVLAGIDADTEILVVDDGSADRTAELAEKAGARVISLPENCGYGAAIKAGIEVARHDKIAITDADGTYPADALPALLARADRYDMVVGSRQGANVAIPWARRPAKWFLNRLASYLAGRRIPDLNSGLRVMDRSLLERYAHVLPQGFSLTTTITLAALCNGHLVYYHPIDYYERSGRSKIRPRHAFDFLLLVLRTVVYFNPLKIFIPLGFVFIAIGTGKFAYDVLKGDFSETALIGFLGGALLWSVGLLADQISRVGLRGGPR